MTAPLRNTFHSSATSASQNTAPVAEFRCLYTNDLRRKQKRWQDGYLKFHSFNSRVMVYDQSRAFLGDTYWKESGALQEGDELTLDKGVMVEVAEAMGVTQTDLNPLFEKKKDPPPASTAPAPPRRFQPPSQVAPSNVMRATSQMRHKSLNTLLGTPKGPIGKALPIVSPYEARKEQENDARREQENKARAEQANEWAVDREAKRQKTVHNSAPRRSVNPEKSLPQAKPAARRLPQPIPRDATVISLDCEPDAIAHISSDITLPGTPPPDDRPTPNPPITPAPAVQTPKPKIPRGKVPVPSVKALETPRQPPPPSSPPVSASNRLSNVEFAMSVEKPKPQPQPRRELPQKQARESIQAQVRELGHERTREPVREQTREPAREQIRQRAQELTGEQARKPVQERRKEPVREPTREPPQNQTNPSLPPASPPRNPKAKSLRLSTGVKRKKLMCQDPPQQWGREVSEPRVPASKAKRMSSLESPSSASRQDTSRKERVTSDSTSTAVPKRKRNEPATVVGDASKRAKTALKPTDVSLDASDETDILGILDQQLLVSPRQATHEPAVAEGIARNDASPLASPKPATTRHLSPQGGREKSQKNGAPRLPQEVSKPAPQPLHQQSKPTSPSRPDATHSRASTSPRKPAFSTGGFTKKPKSKSKTSPAPTVPPTTTVPANDSLPANPAAKQGPTMSTTELAALLSSSIASPSTSKTTKTSPRSFRRVRSENDAPVPSTAEEWEARNLPKSIDPATTATTTMAVSAQTVAPRIPGGGGLSELVKRTDPRRKMARTKSLNVDVHVDDGCVEEQEVQSPVVDTDVGPWSTEAFDLFDWRRPADVDAV